MNLVRLPHNGGLQLRVWRVGPVSKVTAAARVAIPVFLVVGEDDERTPPWMSRCVYDSLPGPKELWVVPGAGHGGRSAPELVAYNEFFERVGAFFKQYLRKEEPDN